MNAREWTGENFPMREPGHGCGLEQRGGGWRSIDAWNLAVDDGPLA